MFLLLRRFFVPLAAVMLFFGLFTQSYAQTGDMGQSETHNGGIENIETTSDVSDKAPKNTEDQGSVDANKDTKNVSGFPKLAVLDFKNAHAFFFPDGTMMERGCANIGKYYSRVLAKVLEEEGVGNFFVLNHETFFEELGQRDIDLGFRPDPDTCRDVNKITGADYLLTGVVTNCTYLNEYERRGVFGVTLQELSPIQLGTVKDSILVSAEVSIVSCHTGKTAAKFTFVQELTANRRGKGLKTAYLTIKTKDQEADLRTIYEHIAPFARKTAEMVGNVELQDTTNDNYQTGTVKSVNKLDEVAAAEKCLEIFEEINGIAPGFQGNVPLITKELSDATEIIFQINGLRQSVQDDVMQCMSKLLASSVKQLQNTKTELKRSSSFANAAAEKLAEKAAAAKKLLDAAKKKAAAQKKTAAKSKAKPKAVSKAKPTKPKAKPEVISEPSEDVVNDQVQVKDVAGNDKKIDLVIPDSGALFEEESLNPDTPKMTEEEAKDAVNKIDEQRNLQADQNALETLAADSLRIVRIRPDEDYSKDFYTFLTVHKTIEDKLLELQESIPTVTVDVTLDDATGVDGDTFFKVSRLINIPGKNEQNKSISRVIGILRVQNVEGNHCTCEVVKVFSPIKPDDKVAAF